ncbi:MAG: FecR domain-containing protein [Bacteroidota bacterium]
MANEEYIKKWLDGSLSEEEKEAFEQSDDYKSITKMDEALKLFKAPEYDSATALNRLKEAKSGAGHVVQVNWFRRVASIAAVIVMAFAFYYFIVQSNNETGDTMIATGFSEKSEVSLPDQSIVTLNASSQLAYDKSSWDTKRAVNLNGEAYFKVAKGAKFDVVTESGTVSVLGTQFNVKHRNNFFEVVCYEGLVKVTSPKRQVELPAGHVFRIMNGQVLQQRDHQYNAPNWVTGTSLFDAVPFMQVIDELQRQYNVQIVVSGVDMNESFTGGFVHDNLSQALESVTLPLQLTYQVLEDQSIEITGDQQ